MLETRKELKERIVSQDAQIAQIENELAETEAKASEAASLAQAATDEKAAAELVLETVQEHLAEAEARVVELEASVEEKTAALEDDEERVTEEAVKELAAVGHETVEIVEDAEAATLTREQFDAHYNSIQDGRERSRWYLANVDRVAK